MPKLRQARQKIRPVRTKIKLLFITDASPGLIERKAFYATPTWRAIRKAQLKAEPR